MRALPQAASGPWMAPLLGFLTDTEGRHRAATQPDHRRRFDYAKAHEAHLHHLKLEELADRGLVVRGDEVLRRLAAGDVERVAPC